MALTCGRGTSREPPTNVALELCTRFRERQVLSRACRSGTWWEAERSAPFFPFIPDQPFKVAATSGWSRKKSTEQNKPLQVQVQGLHHNRGESNPRASVADIQTCQREKVNCVSLSPSWKSAVNGVASACWWTGSSCATSPTRWPRWTMLTPCGSKAI